MPFLHADNDRQLVTMMATRKGTTACTLSEPPSPNVERCWTGLFRKLAILGKAIPGPTLSTLSTGGLLQWRGTLSPKEVTHCIGS